MLVVVEKKFDTVKINKLINELKPSKIFVSQKFADKIKWDEENL